MSSTDVYADWKAPAADGELIIWPEPGDLLSHTRQNQSKLSAAEHVRIQNTPLPRIRRAMRQFLGHDDSQPLLATGHQSELYHPGVWVKDVLIDRAATLLGGQAYHFAVDTDHPKHLHVRWPGESIPITDDPAIATAPWSALLAPPTPAHIGEIERAISRDWPRFGFEPLLPEFLQSLRRSALEPADLSATITSAQHQLDWSLGLRHHAMLVSPLLMSRAFLALAHHIMSRPDAFAASYNRALAAYRKRTGTSSPMRPMPDLFVSDESIEAPFWLDNLRDSTRSRPSVFRTGDRSGNGSGDRSAGWTLELVTGEEFIFRPDLDADEAADDLRKFLERTAHRLAPRALTLTMFLRLLVVDQFVHGIGGGRYDQVTDALIADHFGLEPPAFAVTTATMFFPTALGRDRVCLPCLRQQGHRLLHDVLGSRKRELVAQIEALPRRSPQRQDAFIQMHRHRRAAAAESEKLRQWEQRLREAEARDQEDQVLFDRELFYAVQSRDRLAMMIEKYRSVVAVST